jgi:UDP-glucuronate decarboxylase
MAGHRVLAIDSGVSGDVRALVDQNEKFIVGDILDRDMLARASADFQDVEMIFNLASVASPVRYQLDPVHTLRSNTEGVYNLLEAFPRARFVQTSTSEVYGNPSVNPQPETYHGSVSCTGPRACYDEGKRAAEALLLDYERTRGREIRIARLFNSYGPGMALNDGRAVSNFICAALLGEPLNVVEERSRSFCYVVDTIRGIRLLADSNLQGPVNIGNDNEITVWELATAIVRLTGSKSEIVSTRSPIDDPERRRPDLKRALSIGYEPTVSLDEGLTRTIEHFRAVLGLH